MKAGTYSEGIPCRHKHKPAEPFAKYREHGLVLRVTPALRGNPAQGLVDWGGDYTTWENMKDLEIKDLDDYLPGSAQ